MPARPTTPSFVSRTSSLVRPPTVGRLHLRPGLLVTVLGGGALALGVVLGSPRGAGRAADVFVDVTKERGLAFRNFTGATGRKFLIETMLAGAAWLDFDGDGYLDLYLVQGNERVDHSKPGAERADGPGNVLYRNVKGQRFEDVSKASRTADRGYGMGAAVGDYDGDGDPDLFVANYGRNTLYRNDGNGSFTDVTGAAGVGTPTGRGEPVWSTSASWADFDGDGLLDLFVANYLAYDTRRHGACYATMASGRKVASYCHPHRFDGAPDILYRNLGGGRFQDVSRVSGIAGASGWLEAKGLGVVASDFDGDGDLDLLVANDSVANAIWSNLGGFRFEEVALRSGFAFNANGESEASMGITRGDVDGDGRLDYFLTHFSRETNTLYLNRGGHFVDATVSSGLARAGYLPLGFGTRLLDYDLDGDLDLYVANGHILDNAELVQPGEKVTYAQPDLLFENNGKAHFQDVSRRSGAWFERALVGRCAVEADYDNDGDGDLLVTHVGGPAVLLENRAGDGKNWIGVDLRGGEVFHGAWVEVEVGGRRRVHEVQRDGSYLASHDPRVRFGIPADTETVDVRVRWPGRGEAATRVYKGLEVRRYHVLRK